MRTILTILTFACTSVLLAQSGPKLTWIDKKIKKPTVMENTEVSAYFKFKNEGNEPLLISDAYATCECTTAEFPKQPILPGTTDSVLVVFDGTKLGVFNKPVYVEHNGADRREVIFLKGEVLPLEGKE